MARVPWKMCIMLASYNVLLLVLLQIYGEALAEEVPYHFHVREAVARSNIPRLLKLSIVPISATPAQSAPPPPPPPMRLARPPPPPPPYWWYYVYSSPPPPSTALYYNLPTPPSDPYSSNSSSYSYTAIVALPIIAVVMIFLCSFIWTRNQRVNADEASMSGRNSGSSGDTTAAPAAVALLARQGNSKGLDGALVNKLPILCFTAQKSRISKEGGRKEYMYSCAVCISDFEEGDTMRLLPACRHAFHKDCIDMWLFSHSTCPLCRLGLFNNNGDLILLEEEDNSQRGAHLTVDPVASASRPLDHPVFIKMFRRSQSSSQADMARTRGLALLQRSCSQPLGFSKVHPTHSFS